MMIAGAPPYFHDILKGKTKPERATWLIWSILGVVAFLSQIKLHGGWSLVFLGADALGNIAVFFLSLQYGVGGWALTDKIALVIAVISVTVSIITRNPVIALIGVVLADISGSALTILKTYRDPDSETTITWLFLGTAALLGALGVGHLNWRLLIYPLYLAVATFGVVATQYISRSHRYVKTRIATNRSSEPRSKRSL
jgi:hypothetical protein